MKSNYEHYQEKLMDIATKGMMISVIDGNLCECNAMSVDDCRKCDFYKNRNLKYDTCFSHALLWLMSEYKE